MCLQRQKEQSEVATKITELKFTYCQASHHARSKEWVERNGLPQVLHFPLRSQRLGVGADAPGSPLLHRRLLLPLLDRCRFHALVQAPARLAEVDPLKKLVLQPHWLCPLLGRSFRSSRREDLVAEANLSNWLPPHLGELPFRPVCAFPPSAGA